MAMRNNIEQEKPRLTRREVLKFFGIVVAGLGAWDLVVIEQKIQEKVAQAYPRPVPYDQVRIIKSRMERGEESPVLGGSPKRELFRVGRGGAVADRRKLEIYEANESARNKLAQVLRSEKTLLGLTKYDVNTLLPIAGGIFLVVLSALLPRKKEAALKI